MTGVPPRGRSTGENGAQDPDCPNTNPGARYVGGSGSGGSGPGSVPQRRGRVFYKLLLLSDGDIVASGISAGMAVLELRPGGSLDPSFGTGGVVHQYILGANVGPAEGRRRCQRQHPGGRKRLLD